MNIALRVHYPRRRRSEAVLEKLPGIGIITRNHYGAEILNADSVMFLDWDVPESRRRQPAAAGVLGGLRRLIFGLSASEQAAIMQQEAERIRTEKTRLETRIRAQVTDLGIGLRLYETKSGLRGLITSSQFEPSEAVSHQLMTFLGADDLYVRLCRIQGTYRARLTPKFWRVGLKQRPPDKPALEAGAQHIMNDWLERYRAACQGFATARFEAQIGPPATDGVILETIRLHDARCRAGESLELA